MIDIPIGGIVAWHKDLEVGLSNNWVVCNGVEQNVSIFSPYQVAGKFTPPNLNGYFLRGGTTSGSTTSSESHSHTITFGPKDLATDAWGGSRVDGGTSGTTELKPPAMTVVWIMRVSLK